MGRASVLDAGEGERVEVVEEDRDVVADGRGRDGALDTATAARAAAAAVGAASADGLVSAAVTALLGDNLDTGHGEYSCGECGRVSKRERETKKERTTTSRGACELVLSVWSSPRHRQRCPHGATRSPRHGMGIAVRIVGQSDGAHKVGGAGMDRLAQAITQRQDKQVVRGLALARSIHTAACYTAMSGTSG